MDFELFRADLETALAYSDGTKGGRPSYDAVMMFKILVIQAQNNLSDERAEFLINDRLSFMRFIGLSLGDRVRMRKRSGCSASGWSGLVRSSGCSSPSTGRSARRAISRCPVRSSMRPWRRAQAAQQRWREGGDQGGPYSCGVEEAPGQAPPEGSRRALDGQVLQGEAAGRWDDAVGHRHSQLRLSEPHLDRSPLRLIRKWAVTDAAAYEGRMLRRGLLDQSNTGSAVWADTAYRSKKNKAFIERHGFTSQVHRKKPAGRPMPEPTRPANARKSAPRSRLEHVFAQQKDRMDLFVRTIGIARARAKIGLANLVYNMKRLVWLERTAAT